jgi:Fic family protein
MWLNVLRFRTHELPDFVNLNPLAWQVPHVVVHILRADRAEFHQELNMDANEFNPTLMTGDIVPVLKRSPDVQVAFVPNPLPPKWDWPDDLWTLVVDARRCLSSLDGTGKHLPNPELLMQPLHRREAQLSSKLEGTITDPQQQILFEADPRYPTSKYDPANAYREVYNYRQALKFQLDGQSGLPLSLRLIRELHKILMDGVRGSDQTPGEFRQIQNQIGHPARFVPPPPQYLGDTLNDLEKYMHATDHRDPLVRAFLAHYQFETIHPFRDGNGRVGRLLLSLMIADWCQLSKQWLYMSAYFEKNKVQYMDLLLAVSTRGAWSEWIRFCLEGVIIQSADAEKRCERLLHLQKDFNQRLKGSVRLSQAGENLFTAPVVTVTQYRGYFDVVCATARADLKKLEAAGIVQRLSEEKEITYYCAAIYNITYEEID